MKCVIPYSDKYMSIKSPSEFEKLNLMDMLVVYESVLREILFAELMKELTKIGHEDLADEYVIPQEELLLSSSYLENYLLNFEDMDKDTLSEFKSEIEKEIIEKYKDFLKSQGISEKVH